MWREGNPPPGWVDAVSRVMATGLAVPIELSSEEVTRAYNDWLESKVLTPLRNTSPERYAAVVAQIRTLIVGMVEEAGEPKAS